MWPSWQAKNIGVTPCLSGVQTSPVLQSGSRDGIVNPDPKAGVVADRWLPRVTVADFELRCEHQVFAAALLAEYGMLKLPGAVNQGLADAIAKLCNAADHPKLREVHVLTPGHRTEKGRADHELTRYSVRLTSLCGRQTLKLPATWCNCGAEKRDGAHTKKCGYQACKPPDNDAPTWYDMQTGERPALHDDEKMRTEKPEIEATPTEEQALLQELAQLQARVLCAAHDVLRVLCAVWPDSDTSGVAQAHGLSFPLAFRPSLHPSLP